MKTKFLSVLAISAILFSSCSNDDNSIDESTDGVVRFTAGISNQASATTRAAGAVWGANDAIGVFMVDKGTTTIAESAENNKYTTSTGDGNFAAATGNAIYYPMDGSAVDFIAYYPYTAGKTIGDAIAVDVSGAQTTASQATSDLLWAKSTNSGAGYSKTSSTVALSFQHKLVKIIMNCKVEDNTDIVAADFASATVAISGMNTQTSLSLTNGTVAPATDVANITPRTVSTATGYLASYDAIVLPASYAADDVTVVFTVNNEPYTWTLDAANAAFVAGNQYTYEVTLTRTGVTVTGTIQPWLTAGNDRPGQTAE